MCAVIALDDNVALLLLSLLYIAAVVVAGRGVASSATRTATYCYCYKEHCLPPPLFIVAEVWLNG